MFARIRAMRKALHLSQKNFGKGLGVSRDVISNIEYRRVQPKNYFCNICANYTSINENWLQTVECDMFGKSTNINIHRK